MAKVLTIADANQAPATDVDLLDGTLQLREGSWKTRTAPMQYALANATPYGIQAVFERFEPVTETMDLIGSGAVVTEVMIRAAVRRVENALEEMRKWHGDIGQDLSWWLYWNCEDEDARRSLLFDGSLQFLNDTGVSPMLENNRGLMRLVVTRHPFWEELDYTTITNSSMNALGGSASWAGVRGDVPNRIWQTTVLAPAAGGPMDKIWIGVREEYDGFSNFNPTWECEDGTNHASGDGTDTVDATASDGNMVRVDFSTHPELYERLGITVAQVAAANGHSSYSHFNGRYLVLCRCKVSAGTVGLEMRVGYSATVNKPRMPMVYIENTSWNLLELGTIQIPPVGIRPGTDSRSTEIELWAERIDGAGTLDLDSLTLIPARHQLYIENADIEYNTRNCIYYTWANDERTAIGYTATSTDMVADVSPVEWYLPVDDSIMVVAGDRAAGQNLNDTLSVYLYHYPRYLSYRGGGAT